MLNRLINEDEFYEEFRTYLVRVLGRRPATAKGYIGMGKLAARRLGKHVLTVDSDDLIEVMGTQGWAPATNRAMVVAYHQLDDFAAMKKYGKRNGIKYLKTPKVPYNKKPPIHPWDAHRLLAQPMSPIVTRVVYLGLYAGCRIEESTNMEWHNWRSDGLYFEGKGGKRRKVPIHPELERVKEIILSRKPASKTSAGVLFGRLRDKLDLRDVEGSRATPHSLRRTFSTALYAVKTPWEVVGTLLGHDIGTTDSYVQIGEDVMREAVEKVEYLGAEGVQLQLF